MADSTRQRQTWVAMWFWIITGFLFVVCLANDKGGHGAGQFICGTLGAFTGLVFLTAISVCGDGDPRRKGIEWLILVSGLLTVGFLAAAFERRR